MPELIKPEEALRRVARGEAVLIDIRERNEHAREHIPGAHHLPLQEVDRSKLDRALAAGAVPIFYCQSGNRTGIHRDKLAACADGDCLLLEGGLNAWKASGQETRLDRRQPIELQRQVQIAAGSLMLLGLLLAWLVAPVWAALSAFVGMGLVFAGASGWCGMAKLLAVMPWNKAGGPG